jgi:hypothetical protein
MRQSLTICLVMTCIAWVLCNTVYTQSYTNVAEALGVSALPDPLEYGSGMSFYDFDNDGWDDLTFTMTDDSLVFYRNNQGSFELLNSFIYGHGEVKHVLWVDLNNDTHLDLAISSLMGTYHFYLNDGNFNFTDISVQAGLAQIVERNYGISFADYNKDGFLDFYVAVYGPNGAGNTFATMNHLYRNNGDGTFTDVTLEAGVGDGFKSSFQGTWFDYNNDGWVDLFVINDRIFENSLYRNNGDGTFTDVSIEAGIGFSGEDPMTCTVGDFDNDGDLDVYLTNTDQGPSLLLVNNNDGTFTESSDLYNLDIVAWNWGAVWVDYNNNGFQDLYVSSGHWNDNIEDNFFFTNQNGIIFNQAPEIFEGNHNARSFAPTRGDINNDGYYDIAVLNEYPFDIFLWQNSGGTNNYVKITLQGTVSNYFAIGSWIRVYAGGQQYTQFTMCGENYVSQNSQHHIFGLGTNAIVDSVQIVFPNGQIDNYYNLEVNQSYHFVEGETYFVNISTSGETQFCEGDSVILNAGNHYQVIWNTGDENAEILVNTSGSYWFTATNQYGFSAQSDTMIIVVFPEPAISVNQQNPLCAGDENGAASIVNMSGSETLLVSWSNGMFGESINSLDNGIFYFDYLDVYGCNAQGFVQIQDPLELFAQVFPSPDFGNNDGSMLIIINGGTPPYFVYLDGEEYSTSIFDLQFGTYQVLIEDFHFCTFETQATIDHITTDRNILENTNLLIYPNPTTGILFVDSENFNIKTIRVFDLSGRVVLELESSTQINSIDLRDLTHGCYTIELFDGYSKTYRKIILR